MECGDYSKRGFQQKSVNFRIMFSDYDLFSHRIKHFIFQGDLYKHG